MRELLAIAAACLLGAMATGQTAYTVDPTSTSPSWLDLINGEGLSPGDTVILRAGTYLTPDATRLDIAHVGTAQDCPPPRKGGAVGLLIDQTKSSLSPAPAQPERQTDDDTSRLWQSRVPPDSTTCSGTSGGDEVGSRRV